MVISGIILVLCRMQKTCRDTAILIQVHPFMLAVRTKPRHRHQFCHWSISLVAGVQSNFSSFVWKMMTSGLFQTPVWSLLLLIYSWTFGQSEFADTLLSQPQDEILSGGISGWKAFRWATRRERTGKMYFHFFCGAEDQSNTRTHEI